MRTPYAIRFRGRCTRHVLVAAAVAALVAVPSVGTASAQPDTSSQPPAAELIRPSIVYLESSIPGSWVARCTGFVVSPDGYVATAGHCVDPAHISSEGGSAINLSASSGNAVLAQIAESGMTVTILGAGRAADATRPVAARVVDVRPLGHGDVALLKVPLSNLPSSELATELPRVGDPVHAVGYPASTAELTDYSLEPTVKSGTVSTIATAGTAPVLEVSAPMTAGMSGGPTVDNQGRVLGINSFRPPDEVGEFNFVSAVSELADMLRTNGVVAALSPADDAYRAGLNDFYAGDYADSIGDFDNALALSPGYPHALTLRTDAVRRREASGATSSGGIPSWLPIGAGVLLAAVAVGGIGYYAFTRGGSRSGAQPPPDAVPADSIRPPHSGAAPSPVPATQPIEAPAAGTPQDAGSRCINCGFGLASGQSFCGRCGSPQGR